MIPAIKQTAIIIKQRNYGGKDPVIFGAGCWNASQAIPLTILFAIEFFLDRFARHWHKHRKTK